MYFFDISIISNFLSVELIWRIISWLHKTFFSQPLHSYSGNQVFIWGSNRFVGCPNILAINNKPIIKVDALGKRLYLSADFYDRDGRLVMKIVRNKIKLNENNVFKTEEWKRRKIKIINQFNEPIEIIAHKTGEIELNGVFYVDKRKIEASRSGLKI